MQHVLSKTKHLFTQKLRLESLQCGSRAFGRYFESKSDLYSGDSCGNREQLRYRLWSLKEA
jgi:hypothetical protein